MSVVTYGSTNYSVQVNGTWEIDGKIEDGVNHTWCYIGGPCAPHFVGKSARLYRRVCEMDDEGRGVVKVMSWDDCHGVDGEFMELRWEGCNVMGMLQCEMAEWCE